MDAPAVFRLVSIGHVIFVSLGVSAVLFKPFDPMTLAQQMSDALGWRD